MFFGYRSRESCGPPVRRPHPTSCRRNDADRSTRKFRGAISRPVRTRGGGNARHRKAARMRNRLGWAFVGLLLLVQFLLFRQSAIREVVWSYPPFHDQLTYLGRAYDTYERILDRGLWAGLSESEGFRHLQAEPSPANVMLIPPRPRQTPIRRSAPTGRSFTTRPRFSSH